MEHLDKQQIVLLTLLVSFMTSIVTGIVTVSIINQAPPDTTNTIERVIENTVANALPSDDTAAVEDVVSGGDSLSSSIDKASKSIVKIHEYGSPASVSGLGIVINSHGTIMTDKSVISSMVSDAATYSDGHEYHLAVIQSQINGDIIFLDPLIPASDATSTDFTPASIGNFPKLGETVASLGGNDAGTLGVGVVDQIVTDGTSPTPTTISTTIDSTKTLTGSPLFDISGAIVGIQTSSLTSKSGTEFYPISIVKTAFPK